MSSIISHWLASSLGHIPPRVWFGLWVASYIIGTVALLWVLSLIKNIAGWFGVVVVLLAVTYGYAYTRGALHQPINPFDNPIGAIIEVLK